jgi:hypothetical protein
MTRHPQVEYANIETETASLSAHTMEAYRMLAEKTGLPVEQIAELLLGGESRCLFGADGRLRSAEELRNLGGGRDPNAALDELRRKRIAPGITPSKAQRELMRLRRKGYPR